jgi:hypothetical protein
MVNDHGNAIIYFGAFSLPEHLLPPELHPPTLLDGCGLAPKTGKPA